MAIKRGQKYYINPYAGSKSKYKEKLLKREHEFPPWISKEKRERILEEFKRVK